MAIAHIKIHGKIANAEYQQVTRSIEKAATRDLNALKEKGLIEQKRSRGPGVHYVLAKRGDRMGTKGTFVSSDAKGAPKGHSRCVFIKESPHKGLNRLMTAKASQTPHGTNGKVFTTEKTVFPLLSQWAVTGPLGPKNSD